MPCIGISEGMVALTHEAEQTKVVLTFQTPDDKDRFMEKVCDRVALCDGRTTKIVRPFLFTKENTMTVFAIVVGVLVGLGVGAAGASLLTGMGFVPNSRGAVITILVSSTVLAIVLGYWAYVAVEHSSRQERITLVVPVEKGRHVRAVLCESLGACAPGEVLTIPE